MPAKPHINIITAGHVDAGKSTLIGRLLFDTGTIREEELRKLKDQAAEYKKETFEFAFAMDTNVEERTARRYTKIWGLTRYLNPYVQIKT